MKCRARRAFVKIKIRSVPLLPYSVSGILYFANWALLDSTIFLPGYIWGKPINQTLFSPLVQFHLERCKKKVEYRLIPTCCVVKGNLIQVMESRKGKTFGGLMLKPAEGRKETVRQCFLFSGYLLLTTRSSSGRLHLSKVHHSFCIVRSVVPKSH